VRNRDPPKCDFSKNRKCFFQNNRAPYRYDVPLRRLRTLALTPAYRILFRRGGAAPPLKSQLMSEHDVLRLTNVRRNP
jgi:hypothetical protein